MEYIHFIVCLQVVWFGVLHNAVSSHPTPTTDLTPDTTIVDIIYETTTNNLNEINETINLDDNIDVTTIENINLSNDDETSTVLHEVTQNQQDVVEELNELWNYSESLDETEGDLKSSLNSIVHLAYARVQVEPEETLDRLKNLLRKLRTRLSITSSSSQEEEAINNERNQEKYINRRRKRNISGDEFERIKNLFTAVTLASLLQQQQEQEQQNPEEQVTSTEKPLLQQNITIPSGDARIQKIIHIDNSKPFQLQQPRPMHQLPLSSSTIIQTNVLMKNESGELPSPITAENIANAILKLLHQNTLPFEDAGLYAEKVNFKTPEINTNVKTTTSPASTLLFSIQPPLNIIVESNSAENEISSEQIPFELGLRSSTIKWNDNNNTEFDNLLKDSDIFPIPNISSIENTNSIGSSDTTSSSSSSAVINIFDELTASNILMSPIVLLNGTREGMIQFIQTFNILTFKTKMIILFVLSISVLSIALGIYSLGPPIIGVGAIGILIPILLLFILQNQDQNDIKKRKTRIGGGGGSSNGKDPLLKELNYILDLILKAGQKYV